MIDINILDRLKNQRAEYTVKIEKTEQERKDQMASYKELIKDYKTKQKIIAESISSNDLEPILNELGPHALSILGLKDDGN